MISRLLAAPVLLVATVGTTRADTWGPPQAEHWSRNRTYVLRLGGKDGLELHPAGPIGAQPIWSRGFVNGHWPPHCARVADDGRHVVLIDAHGSLGFDEVLVFLGPQGEVLHSYKLEEILTDKEILNAVHSVSSIHWSQHGWFVLRDRDRQFAFVTQIGTVRVFDTATGRRLPLTDQLRAQIVSEAIMDARLMLGADDPAEQMRGAVLLGVLNARAAVGELQQMLSAPSATAPAGARILGHDPNAGVQAAAASALLRITGQDALELVEQCLSTLPSGALPQFLEVLSDFDRDGYELGDPARVQVATELWDRLARHPNATIRTAAQAQRLERDDGRFLRAHPDLLQSRDRQVRYQAYVYLSQHALPAEVPLLRAGLDDADDINRVWAWRGLVRLAPSDIEDILKQALATKDSPMPFEACMELARRGDATAKQRVLTYLGKMKDHAHTEEGWAVSEFEARDLCVLVAEIKLKAAREPLRAALQNPCRHIQRAACGALAVLGDQEALLKLRELARQGHALDRAGAIDWLNRAQDRGSTEFLRQAATDEEPWIREAATKALANLDAHSQTRPAAATQPVAP